MMRTRRHIRWDRLILVTAGAVCTVAAILGIMYGLVIGVVNTSFRYAPPSAEELRENPTLARYVDPDDVIVETYRK